MDFKDNNDIDVFVVDDGSTDNLKEVVKPYLKANPDTIHYFKKENGNQGSCINYGIERANSKFFSLLDSDDTFNPKDFNTVLGILRNLENVDLVISNYRFFFMNPDKTKIEKVMISKTRKPIKYVDIDDLSLFSLITIHSTIYRTDMLKEIKPMPEKLGFSDCVLCYEVLLKANRVAYLNRSIALYNYHIRRQQQLISLNNSIAKFDDFIKVLD
ncbi:MAG: glycosyltransferase family 2 protein [Mycoplasmoidaceae bacterium]|nr:glycosyltransferase family 2 protein [Mycoplasmoidaceae bacterium]